MVGFAKAVKWHNFAAIILTFNYIIFVIGNLLTGNGRYYRIERENFMKDLIAAVKILFMGNVQGRKASLSR